MISMASTSQEQEVVVVPVNVDLDFLINKCGLVNFPTKVSFMYIKHLKRPCPDVTDLRVSKTLVTTGKQNSAFTNSW
jgi:hypothetical protein